MSFFNKPTLRLLLLALASPLFWDLDFSEKTVPVSGGTPTGAGSGRRTSRGISPKLMRGKVMGKGFCRDSIRDSQLCFLPLPKSGDQRSPHGPGSATSTFGSWETTLAFGKGKGLIVALTEVD